MGIHATFALINRAEIEAEIERLIGLLDAVDAPLADLEPEQDFGVDDRPQDPGDGQGLHSMLPAYGVDQSTGPLNYREVSHEHTARELGLVRTATGWRQ